MKEMEGKFRRQHEFEFLCFTNQLQEALEVLSQIEGIKVYQPQPAIQTIFKSDGEAETIEGFLVQGRCGEEEKEQHHIVHLLADKKIAGFSKERKIFFKDLSTRKIVIQRR